MLNASLAQRLTDMGTCLELLGEQSFRVAAYAKASRAIEGLAVDVATLSREELVALDGIGDKMAERVVTFIKTGELTGEAEVRAKVPAGLFEVLAVPGLGPKTVRAMWQELGVTDRAGLERAIANGSLLSLPRMGEKAVEKIRQSLALTAQGQERLTLGVAHAVVERVLAVVRSVEGVRDAQAAGSMRRAKETVGDLDVIACLGSLDGTLAQRVMDAVVGMAGVQGVLARGEFKASVVLDIAQVLGGDSFPHPHQQGKARSVQCDVRVVPVSSMGATLQYFTGSKEHNVRLRTLAQSKGLTLNEWGLYDDATWRTYRDAGQVTQDRPPPRGVVDASEERAIYEHLGVAFVPPEMREDRGELTDPNAAHAADHLVEPAHIRSELHAHTTASDGVMSIEALARAAHARGFHTIAVTDHSQSSTIAKGLKPDRLRSHILAVREVAARLKDELGITVLTGSEVDILADGALDYDDDLLAQLDVVVASPHAALTQQPAVATKRLLRAIRHPLVHIMGHPTGRIVMQRPGLEPAIEEIVAAAKEHNVALEINSHWSRLDLRDTHVRHAIDAGCLLAIDCDVHYPGDFDNLRFGVATARRGWATQERVINTWDAATLHAWLRRKR